MSPRKILVLHASAGAGHTQAALAVVEALGAHDPAPELLVADALQFSTPIFRRTYVASYNNIVRRAPGLWGFLYRRTSGRRFDRGTAPARLTFDQLSVRRLRAYLRRERPDAVLCTHFLPLALLSHLRLKDPDAHPWPLYVAITDYTAHPFWVFAGVSCYFVSSGNVAEELAAQGVGGDRVRVTGIPAHPRFARRGDASEARLRLGLNPGAPTVLVMGGGIGMGHLEKVVERVLHTDPAYQCIAVCGRNARLRRALQARYEEAEERDGRIAIRGFVKDVDRLMDAATLVVSKAGGLTTAESLAKGLPMLVLDPIPGQEERNCNFLEAAGAGIRLADLDDLGPRLREVLGPGGRLSLMRAAATLVSRPMAAQNIAELVLGGAGVSAS
ncbi:MAG: galactosyldiacylglycerol synthase [Candidatus Eisenbacteria bacterium]|nr:galactosyldiacylglycerol synthase [Candidatus Eisenbacteria bacterium]